MFRVHAIFSYYIHTTEDIKVFYGSGSGNLVRNSSIIHVNNDHIIDSDHHPSPMPRHSVLHSRLPSFKVKKDNVRSTEESGQRDIGNSIMLKGV